MRMASVGFSFFEKRRHGKLNIPATLRAGDTIEWDESLPDYPASDGWTLAFVLTRYGQSLITIIATPSGDDYAISILPATTRAWIPGIYSWQAYVYKEAGTPVLITEKYTLESGQVQILPDIAQATSITDLRSHAKKVLDAIEALLEGKATADVMSYSIAGRSLSKMNPEELIKWRSFYKTEYQRELEAEAIAKGEDNPRRIGVRFKRL
jgi:hypothetical protein